MLGQPPEVIWRHVPPTIPHHKTVTNWPGLRNTTLHTNYMSDPTYRSDSRLRVLLIT